MRFIPVIIAILLVMSACDRHRPADILGSGPIPLFHQDDGTPQQNVPAPCVVSPDTNGNILSRVGDTVEIKILNSYRDAGYLWTITTDFSSTIAKYDSVGSEAAKLALYADEKIDSIYGRPIIFAGRPGYQIWRYITLRKGNTSMEIKLFRWWKPQEILGIEKYSLAVK